MQMHMDGMQKMGRMRKYSFEDRKGSIGIGALIVFIALVLIAGMAASVIIQSSTNLETQTLKTGRDTKTEVSTGIAVCAIEGYAASSSDISKLAIMVRPRAGTDLIDLSGVYIELSNSTVKVILNHTTSFYSEPDGLDNIFGASVFPDTGGGTDATQFGLLVVEDADNSISSTNYLINRGDKVYLCINATASFNNITERTNMWGSVVPEEGFAGSIKFTTPSTYSDNIIELK
jgi:flagellin FlaB